MRNRVRVLLGCALAVFITFYSHLSYAQQEPQERTGVYALGEIVVSGEQSGVEKVETVREITAQDIEDKDARTLDEALELLPGLAIRTGADGVPRVDIRGFRSRHVTLLLDGVPLNSTYDGQFDPSLIPTENIAKIKVVYSNSSVLYGPGDLGGVINIITKTGTKGLHGSASGEAGDRETFLERFTLSGGYDKANFFVSGSHESTDGFPLSNGFEPTSLQDEGLRVNSDSRRTNIFGNFGFSPSETWLFGANFSYIKAKYGVPPITIDNSKDDFAQKPRFERVDDVEGYTGQINISFDPHGPFALRSWFFLNLLNEEPNRYDNENYNSMSDPTVQGTYHLNRKTRIVGGNIQGQYDFSRWGLATLAVSGEEDHFDESGFIRDVPVSNGGQKKTYETRDVDTDKSMNIYSAALEYEVSPVNKLGLVFGYSHHWMDTDSSDDNDWGFLAGANYDILADTRLRGSVSRKIRFPSLRQLYDEDGGNPGLTPEKSLTFEAGVDQKLPWNSLLTLTGFYIKVDDYIEKSDDTDLFENNEKYRFQGVEFTASARPVKNMFLRLGYTFMDTKDESSGTEKDQLQYRPENKFTLEGRYEFDCGFSLYSNLIYLTDQYYYSRNEPLQKRKLDDFVVVSAKAAQRLLKDRLLLYFGIDNLFDQNYEESYGFPQAGRFIYGGIEIRM